MKFNKDDRYLEHNAYIEMTCQFIEDEKDPTKMRLFSCNLSVYGSAGLDLADCGNMTLKEVIAERLGLRY